MNNHHTSDASRRYAARRRQARAVKLMLGLAAVLAAIAADRAGLLGHGRSGGDFERYNGVEARVVRVVDGDTLDVDLADPVAGHPTTRIRLLGIDTPETKRPDTPVQHYGPEASARTKALAQGRRVRLELGSRRRTRGNHGRLLAYVALPDGRQLNRLLVGEGFAYADPRFAHPLKADFTSEMSAARREKRGLWRDASPTDLPYYLRPR